MTRRALTLVLLGLGSYAILLFLAPRLSPTRNWNYQLDRQTAIEQARETASGFGINAREWAAYATADSYTSVDYYLMTRASAATIVALAPVRTFVTLVEPRSSGKQSVRVELDAQGRAIGFNHRLEDKPSGDDKPSGATADDTNNPNTTTTIDIAQTRARASEGFARLLGEAAWRDFKLVSENKSGSGEAEVARSTWERRVDDAPDLTMRAVSEVKGERVADLSVEPHFAPSFNDAVNGRRAFNGIVTGIGGFGTVFIVLIAIGLYVLALTKRKLTFILPLVLFGLIAVAFALNRSLYGILDSAMSEVNEALPPLIRALLGISILSFFTALGFALLWSVGDVYARRSQPLKIASFVALLRGKLTTRFVARAIAYGVLCGGILAAVPYFIKAVNLFPSLELDRVEAEYLISRAPAVALLIQPLDFVLFALFAFVTPAIATRARLVRLAPVVVFFIGGAWMMSRVSSLSSYSMIIVGVILILILLEIYRRFDLLTLITATLAAQTATLAASLLVVASPSLQASAWRVFGSLAAVTIVALVIGARGRDANIESEIEPITDDERSQQAERERLVADFSIARQAQQRMLPDRAPQIPGYEIAATCRPAREVGGDLYDFLRLPDERIGIVVADVSGKGIPAALYMTLTKGLLASIAEHESDPKLILQRVNHHLYEVCRRKMFVTLVLAVLDPATRKLTYVRAGHNPPVWRKAATNETIFLHAPGLGLGLNKGKLFDAILKPETITLQRGDAVVFYSDGITEAMDAANTEYDEKRLMDIITRADGLSADATQEALMEDVGVFLGDVQAQDDQTVVVLRVMDDI